MMAEALAALVVLAGWALLLAFATLADMAIQWCLAAWARLWDFGLDDPSGGVR